MSVLWLLGGLVFAIIAIGRFRTLQRGSSPPSRVPVARPASPRRLKRERRLRKRLQKRMSAGDGGK
jgi:hypothetical protein